MTNSVAQTRTQNSTFLGNIPITWRIGFLVALGLVALAAVETFTTMGRINLETSIAQEEAFTEMDITVLKVDAGALMLRRREKDFLIRKDLKYWDKYQIDHKETITLLNELKAIPEATPALTHIDQVIESLNEHKVQFKKAIDMIVVLGLNEKEGLQGQLRKAVHEVEDKLKEAKLDELTVKMLMMRRHEKDFMLRGAEKYLGRIEKRGEEFIPLLAKSALADKEKTLISSLMDSYQKEMKAFGSNSIALVPEVKNLSAIYKTMAPSLDSLNEFASDGLNHSQGVTTQTRQTTELTVRITSIAAGLILLILGVVVMRSLTRPIQLLTTATTELSEGDFLVDIPAIDNKDEVGAMARALVIFKNGLSEAETLRIEQKKAEEKSTAERRHERNQMAKQFETRVGTIVQTVSSAASQMKINAESMNSSSAQTTNQPS